jgi:hypothetical protein
MRNDPARDRQDGANDPGGVRDEEEGGVDTGWRHRNGTRLA